MFSKTEKINLVHFVQYGPVAVGSARIAKAFHNIPIQNLLKLFFTLHHNATTLFEYSEDAVPTTIFTQLQPVKK